MVLLGLVSYQPVSSSELAAVTLLYFRGVGRDKAILLEWATGTEFNTAGFRLERADSEAGPYRVLDQIGFVPAEGDGIVGADYEALDSDNVVNGRVYWYELIEIELDGTENLAGPISVSAGPPTATPTNSPTPTSTPTTPGGNDNITSTPDPSTATQTSTATPANNAPLQSTPSPTSETDQGTPTRPVNNGTSQATPSPDSDLGDDDPSLLTPASTPEVALDLGSYPGPSSLDTPGSPQATRLTDEPGYPASDGIRPSPAGDAYPLMNEGRVLNLTPPVDLEPTIQSAIIGSQDSGSLEGSETNVENNRSGRSAIILWIGFIAALLVFIAGVTGSIIYFSRQRIQGR